MNTYKVDLKVEVEIQAFNENDATEYINDIFGVDDEITGVHITSIQKK